MTHKEVISQWIWKNYIEPWMKTAECVAWAKKYCNQRWYPIKSFWWSAWNGWVTWSPFDSKWKKVVKTSLNYPKEWDILFWSEKRCKYGHVAVANRMCTPMTLRYSDQNGTWKWDKIQHRFWTYLNVVWWMTRI